MPPSKEFLDLVGRMTETHVKKNQDYSGNNDAFFNFDFAAQLVSNFKSPIDQVFVSLIGVKLARLSVLLSGDLHPVNESIDDSFLDGTNYFALWGARRSRDLKPMTPLSHTHSTGVERIGSFHILQSEDKRAAMHEAGFYYRVMEREWYKDKGRDGVAISLSHLAYEQKSLAELNEYIRIYG